MPSLTPSAMHIEPYLRCPHCGTDSLCRALSALRLQSCSLTSPTRLAHSYATQTYYSLRCFCCRRPICPVSCAENCTKRASLCCAFTSLWHSSCVSLFLCPIPNIWATETFLVPRIPCHGTFCQVHCADYVPLYVALLTFA